MALTDDLIAHWKLDEASGTRNDSHGTNHLTDNNTVGSAAGKLGDAADFVAANSESLSRLDNSDLSTGNIDFTIAGWVYLASKPAASLMIASKDSASSGGREWQLGWNQGTDRFSFGTGQGSGSGIDVLRANNFGSPSTGVWYFLMAWHDAAAGKIYISVNNGTPDEASRTSGPPDSTTPFYIGRLGAIPGFEFFWNGRIDEFSFWKRVLTSDERTELWNDGDGLDYEDFAGGTTEITGDHAGTFGGLSGSAAGTVLVSGSQTADFGGLAGSASGAVEVTGSSAGTFASLGAVAAGTVQVSGAHAGTFGTLSGEAAGFTTTILGTHAGTFGEVIGVAVGSVASSEPVTHQMRWGTYWKDRDKPNSRRAQSKRLLKYVRPKI